MIEPGTVQRNASPRSANQIRGFQPAQVDGKRQRGDEQGGCLFYNHRPDAGAPSLTRFGFPGPNAPRITSAVTLAVLILAAGASSRMGRPKLLLPWHDTTVLGHLLAQWRRLEAAQIAVVTAPEAASLLVELDRLGVAAADRLVNPQPERGMFSSVQCAARWPGWRPAATHFAVTLGDQPLVQEETLREFLHFVAGYPDCIAQPARNGRPRHPVVLPQRVWAEVGTARDETLKAFLNARDELRALREFADAGLDLDLDTPADYQRARALTGQGGTVAEN